MTMLFFLCKLFVFFPPIRRKNIKNAAKACRMQLSNSEGNFYITEGRNFPLFANFCNFSLPELLSDINSLSAKNYHIKFADSEGAFLKERLRRKKMRMISHSRQ